MAVSLPVALIILNMFECKKKLLCPINKIKITKAIREKIKII